MKKKIGRPTRFQAKDKISKLVSENPRRKGSKAHISFEIIKNNMTVERYFKAGGDMRDLRYCVDKGWLRIGDA